MASLNQITTLCIAGRVQEAYDLAKEDLKQGKPWAKLITGRALSYFIREDANSGQYARLVAHLDEMIALGQLLPDNENSIFWIGFFCKKHLVPTSIDTPLRLSALFSKLKNFSFAPGKGYSVLLEGFIRCDSWQEMDDFLEWWNLDKLTPVDYQPVVIAQGKTIISLAERAYIAKSKALIRLNDNVRIKGFLPKLDSLMNNHPNMIYPGYFYGKLLLSLGATTKEVLRVILPFARKKATEFWVWQLLSDVFVNDHEKQLACLLRATHCLTQENFLVNVRIKLTRLFILQKQFNLAKYQIDKVTQCFLSHGWRLPYEVYCWTHESWFISAISSDQAPIDYLSITDDILCKGTEEAVAIVTYVDMAANRTTLIYGKEKRIVQKLPFKVGLGAVLKINYIIDSNGKARIIRATQTPFPEYLDFAKVVEGTTRKRTDKDFAFLKTTSGDFYIAPNIVRKYDIQDGEIVKSLVVYDYNRNRAIWDWTCVSIKNKNIIK